MNTDLLQPGREKKTFWIVGLEVGEMEALDVSATHPSCWRLNMRPFQLGIKASEDEMGSDSVSLIREQLQLTA